MARVFALVRVLALLAAFAALVWLGGGDDTASADDPTVVGIDMNPAGNSCPSDCTLGPIHGCREVSSEDVIDFDVFLSGIPVGDSVLGFGYVLDGWAGVMTDQVHLDSGVNLVCQSPPGCVWVEFNGEDIPDFTPPHHVSVADFGTAEYNPPYTEGVLGRYTLDLAGVAPGIYTMTLSYVSVGRDVPPGGALTIDEIWDGNFSLPYGQIAVDQLCPDADEDLWSDAEEVLICTDRLDNCTDQPGDNDAWPPDIDTSSQVNILDILMYKPVLNGPHDARYDLDTTAEVNILDVLMFKPLLGTSCAGP